MSTARGVGESTSRSARWRSNARRRGRCSPGRGTRPLGLEADHLSWSAQRVWDELLGAVQARRHLQAVEALREVKDAAEIARMERAAAIADAALFDDPPPDEPGRDRGALRPRARYGHAPPRRREHRVRDDRRRRRELGQAAPPPRRSHHREGRPGRRGLRRHLRGLPLRHDPHVLRQRGPHRRAAAIFNVVQPPRPPAPSPSSRASA